MDDDGWRDGNLTVMDDATATRRRGMARGASMAMDDEERRERDGDVGAAGGGSNKGQHSIKTKNVVID